MTAAPNAQLRPALQLRPFRFPGSLHEASRASGVSLPGKRVPRPQGRIMASWFAGLRPLAGARAACELPADAVVSLRMADGGEASFPLLQVQGRQVVAAVPWRKTRSAQLAGQGRGGNPGGSAERDQVGFVQLRLPALPGRTRDHARRRDDRRGGLPHRPAAPTPSPPTADPARSPGRLERLHPPRRRAAHPKAPRPPRPARPQPRSPPARHQDRHPHQPGPPARDHRRHRPSARRARRATHADRLRRAIRPRRPPRPGVTRTVPKEQERQSRNVIPTATRGCSLTRQPGHRELFNYDETPSSRCSSSRDPYSKSTDVAIRPASAAGRSQPDATRQR